MKSEWKNTPAKEFCASVRDGTHDSPKPATHGRYLITSRHITNRQLNLSSAYLISQEDFDAVNNRSKVNKWDVLISMIGTVGEPFLVNAEPDFAIKNIGLFKSKGEAEGKWLYYYLQSPATQRLIQSQSRGTTQQYIPLGALRELPISVPASHGEMQSIVRVLSSLDDKIELNRRTNATLESLAQTLFRAWFVDFEPVKAKAAGVLPSGMDAQTAALFPSEFEQSTLGLIPKGWEIQSLDSAAEFLNGLALQKYRPEADADWLPVIKISQLRKGSANGEERASTHIGANYIVNNGDVLFSWSGSLEVRIWCGGRGALNQHLFKVTSAKFPKWFYYLWTLHHLEFFRGIAADKATTMGHIQRRHLTEAKVVVPPLAQLEAIGKVIAPLLDRQINNSLESQTLAQLRDTLLPRLISGRLRVPEAMREVEATA